MQLLFDRSTTLTPPVGRCPACGAELEGEQPNYCDACTAVLCPFCHATEECPHYVGHNWGGDWAYSSIDDLISYEQLDRAGYSGRWELLDELVESSPVPIVTIDFFNPAMAFSRRHFAEDGAKARGILEARVRELALAAEAEAGNG